MDVEVSDVLPLLEAQAERLNKASETVNAALSSIEKRLVASHIGMEFWFERPLLFANSVQPRGDAIHDYTEHRLGFAKVEDNWCLAVRLMHVEAGFFEGDTSAPYESVHAAGDSTPLLQSQRALRMAAMRLMPDFLSALAEHVQTTVDEVEAVARKLKD